MLNAESEEFFKQSTHLKTRKLIDWRHLAPWDTNENHQKQLTSVVIAFVSNVHIAFSSKSLLYTIHEQKLNLSESDRTAGVHPKFQNYKLENIEKETAPQ